jgi:arrestin-related trafficking adapter 1
MKIQRRSSNEKNNKPAKKEPLAATKSDKKIQPGSEPYSLSIRFESPPLVAFGPPEDSSGALLSGILDLTPRQLPNITSFEVDKLEMKLVMEVSTRRPIGHNCPACTTRSKILHTWMFIPSRRTFPYNNGNKHGFPFSFLLPGNLPATTRSSLATVSYKLVAEATPAPHAATPSNSGPGRPPSPKRTDSNRPVIHTQPLNFSRSILPSVEPKTSQRIFPPTSLSAMLTLPTVIFPGSTDNAIDVTISGLKINETKLRWSLRKITWRIDELAKVVSPACAQHSSKVGGVEGKGILYEDTRTVGAGEKKSGWKNDHSGGKIECVLHIGSAVQARAACDVSAMSGVHVSHTLVIECVVAEELLHAAIGPAKKGGQYQPTGNARVLRMSFPMMMTERGGMGISWDEEIPPRYEDVAWNAPPTFAQSEGSADAAERDSMEGIEAVEGIIRPQSSGSPFVFHRRQSGSPSFGTPLARTDSDVSSSSNLRI